MGGEGEDLQQLIYLKGTSRGLSINQLTLTCTFESLVQLHVVR